MADRIHKNMFTNNLVSELIKAIEQVNRDPDIPVVVLQGYDNYFCSGGTKDGLLAIYNNEYNFTKIPLTTLLLDCDVPVIAAMQGHAMGGGLVFGCYADVILLAEECVYSANFMKYGFTPGMGGTYIIPKKFGENLGREMLMSAKTYFGKDLKQLCAPVRILPKANVVPTAKKIASEMAEKPREALIILKKHMNRDTRMQLPEVIEEELNMHALTFRKGRVKELIDEHFLEGLSDALH